MKFNVATALATAPLFLAGSWVEAKHGHASHAVLERRHQHHRKLHASRAETGLEVAEVVEKRGGQCQFPTNAGLVAVTPDQQNAGWAMSPNQPCKPGNYCPYACPSGQLMAQWDPSATSYSYPQSQNGGLYCDNGGNIHKPFPDKPYCVNGTGSVGCKNEAGSSVAVCQTVLPGNEAMLIPTVVESFSDLAVPDTTYWAETAAHYYVNPPGISTEEACIWGTSANPHGNWSPYVTGANTDASGNTFVKIGWNPVYLEPATPFRNQMPSWGIRIECQGSGCNGLPCEIDPSTHKVNQCSGSDTSGAGGAAFCVVTVPKGQSANVVVFGSGSSGSSGGSSSASSSASSSSSTKPASSAQVNKAFAVSSTSSSSSTSHSSSSASTSKAATPTATPSSSTSSTAQHNTTSYPTVYSTSTNTTSSYATPSSVSQSLTPANLTSTYVVPAVTSQPAFSSSPAAGPSTTSTPSSGSSLMASAVGAGLSAVMALLMVTL